MVFLQALRRRNAELQVQVRALLVERCKDGQQNSGRDEGDSTGVFSLANIKKNIQEAVRELATMSENDKKDRIKALRLRWHPDKNPVLQVHVCLILGRFHFTCLPHNGRLRAAQNDSGNVCVFVCVA